MTVKTNTSCTHLRQTVPGGTPSPDSPSRDCCCLRPSPIPESRACLPRRDHRALRRARVLRPVRDQPVRDRFGHVLVCRRARRGDRLALGRRRAAAPDARGGTRARHRAYFVLAGIARLGNVTDFIAKPVLRGFSFGLALVIILRQVATVAGVHPASSELLWFVIDLVGKFASWNWAGVAVGAVALGLLVLLGRFRQLPGGLIVIALGIAGTRWLDLPHYGVGSSGRFTSTCPRRRCRHCPGSTGCVSANSASRS